MPKDKKASRSGKRLKYEIQLQELQNIQKKNDQYNAREKERIEAEYYRACHVKWVWCYILGLTAITLWVWMKSNLKPIG